MRYLTFSLEARQNRNPSAQTPREDQPQCYSTNIPAALLIQQSDLIEQLKGFARSQGARRLEVYVRDAE